MSNQTSRRDTLRSLAFAPFAIAEPLAALADAPAADPDAELLMLG